MKVYSIVQRKIKLLVRTQVRGHDGLLVVEVPEKRVVYGDF